MIIGCNMYVCTCSYGLIVVCMFVQFSFIQWHYLQLMVSFLLVEDGWWREMMLSKWFLNVGSGKEITVYPARWNISIPHDDVSLRIQVYPKKGITPKILLWGWDWNPQSYSRNGFGFLGYTNYHFCLTIVLYKYKLWTLPPPTNGGHHLQHNQCH